MRLSTAVPTQAALSRLVRRAFWARPLFGFILAGLLVGISTVPARAWSSKASKTFYGIRSIESVLSSYSLDHDKLPAPEEVEEVLSEEGLESSTLVDEWNRPFVYRMPGSHGAYDLYSIGADGIDNAGTGDDISNWAGVNDGYHWKATWPKGRRTIVVGLILGALCLLLARYLRWGIVLPLATAVICVATILGCQWLSLPGIVPGIGILGMITLLTIFLLFGSVAIFFKELRKPRASTDTLPSFLTKIQICELLDSLDRNLKLSMTRFRLGNKSLSGPISEITVEELGKLLLGRKEDGERGGGDFAVELPGARLIGHREGLYWLEPNS